MRFTGGVDAPICYAVIDQMKLLRDFFQFRTIDLQLDRPGSQAP
jgi:hypothetical protein